MKSSNHKQNYGTVFLFLSKTQTQTQTHTTAGRQRNQPTNPLPPCSPCPPPPRARCDGCPHHPLTHSGAWPRLRGSADSGRAPCEAKPAPQWESAVLQWPAQSSRRAGRGWPPHPAAVRSLAAAAASAAAMSRLLDRCPRAEGAGFGRVDPYRRRHGHRHRGFS